MSISCEVDHQTVDYPSIDAIKQQKSKLLICNNMDVYQKRYVKWKRPNTKDYTLYGFIYLMF